jgi:hypothetical protein
MCVLIMGNPQYLTFYTGNETFCTPNNSIKLETEGTGNKSSCLIIVLICGIIKHTYNVVRGKNTNKE